MAQNARLIQTVLTPVYATALLTGAKSFRWNPLLASPRLNRGGRLHAWRIRLAERMASRRKAALSRLVDSAHADQIDRDGFAMIANALPAAAFARLSEEVETARLPAREMKQGDTVTRFITLTPEILDGLPGLAGFVRGRLFQGLLRYTASLNHDPLVTLHTVLTDPEAGQPDPQTMFHSDTFHATAKAWFFLRDVAVEDGPFCYVPGSHRITSAREEWERAASQAAAAHANPHHAAGSFRAEATDLDAMGYPAPEVFAVKANTLVVADTHGFHARGISHRPSTRLAIYGSLRGNPFAPVTWADPFRLPGLAGRRGQALDLLRAAAARATGRSEGQPLVGTVRPGDPAIR